MGQLDVRDRQFAIPLDLSVVGFPNHYVILKEDILPGLVGSYHRILRVCPVEWVAMETYIAGRFLPMGWT